MNIGDLVLYLDKRSLVRSADKMTRTVILLHQDGSKVEIPDDWDHIHADICQVLGNPGRQWKVLSVKIKPGAGPFLKATVPQPLLRKEKELEPWVDWIASDPFREGGSIFVNPKTTQLKVGEMLILTHRNGSTVRAPITSKFSTVSQLKTAKVPVKKPEVNRFTNILDDDD